MANLVTEFSQADLNGSNQFILTHNLNKDVTPTYYDENGVQQHTFGVFQVDSAIQCTLSLNNTITGTHKLILSYDAETPAVSGVKLFDRPTASYDNTYNIALGKSGTPTINVPIENFSDKLAAGLYVPKKDLSDVDDPTTALTTHLKGRTAYQISQDLAKKTDRYNQSQGGAALSVDNTKLYTPTSKYHPATLQTVNNTGVKVLYAGRIDIYFDPLPQINLIPLYDALGSVSFSFVTNGQYRINHNVGSTDYDVIVTPYSSSELDFHINGAIDRNSNSFDIAFARIVIGGLPSSSLIDTEFYFQIIQHEAKL